MCKENDALFFTYRLCLHPSLHIECWDLSRSIHSALDEHTWPAMHGRSRQPDDRRTLASPEMGTVIDETLLDSASDAVRVME